MAVLHPPATRFELDGFLSGSRILWPFTTWYPDYRFVERDWQECCDRAPERLAALVTWTSSAVKHSSDCDFITRERFPK